MLKKISVLVISICFLGLLFIQTSEMFSDFNCVAAKLHQKGELIKIQLLLAPDYAKRSDVERIVIQGVCKFKW